MRKTYQCTQKKDGDTVGGFAKQSADRKGGVSMGKGITYSTSGRDCPCCGCQERSVGCHGKCDQYKAWDGKRQAEKMERFRKTSILHEADKRKSATVSHYKRRGRQI